jgi:hypothetical protein
MCANLRKVVTVWSRKAFLSAAAAAAAAALSSALLLLLLLTLLLLSVRAPATAKQSTRHCTSSACTPRVLLLLLLLLVLLAVTTLVPAAVCKSLSTACTREGVVKICTLNLNRLSEEVPRPWQKLALEALLFGIVQVYACRARDSVSRHAVRTATGTYTDRSCTTIALKVPLKIVNTIMTGMLQRSSATR